MVRCEALPTAAALLRLAPALWAQGLAVPAEQAMPLYIRDKVANTTAEREAMKAERQKSGDAQGKAMLEKFDTDKDGKISPEEREAMKAEREKEMEQRRKADFDEFEADKDGKLSYDEFVKLGEHHRAEMMKITKALNNFRLMISGSAALPITTLEEWKKISGQVLL